MHVTQAVDRAAPSSRNQSRREPHRRESEDPSRRQRERSRDDIPRMGDSRQSATMQEARRAAEYGAPARPYDYSRPPVEPISRDRSRGSSDEEAMRSKFDGMRMSSRPQQLQSQSASAGASDVRAPPYRPRSSQDSEEVSRRQQDQQMEMFRREEEIKRRREVESQRRAEREGILQRQQEAEAAARRARRSRSPSPLPPPTLQPHAQQPQMPQPAAPTPAPGYPQPDERRSREQDAYGRWQQGSDAAARMPQPQPNTSGLTRQNTMPAEMPVRRLPVTPEPARYQEPQPRPLGPSATSTSHLRPDGIAFLPLESPTKYEDETDRESVSEERSSSMARQQPSAKQRSRTPART
jgi:hypothetical protein